VREILSKLPGPKPSNDELNFGKVVEEINAGK